MDSLIFQVFEEAPGKNSDKPDKPKMDAVTYHRVLDVSDTMYAYMHFVLLLTFAIYIIVAVTLKTHHTHFQWCGLAALFVCSALLDYNFFDLTNLCAFDIKNSHL